MIHVERLHDGALWDVAFGDGKGNILDSELVRELTELFVEARATNVLRAVCLRGQGDNFSYGASVEEHLRENVGEMLPRFHGLFRALVDSQVVCLAAIRGKCLGGGLELACLCHRVFAAPNAAFAQPEIVLGVIAPIASVFLSERVGRANAEDLCLTGRTISSGEAFGMGLVDVLADSPVETSHRYASEYLLRHSASSLRFAVGAARHELSERLAHELPKIERIYLEQLMETDDAQEGIKAFVDKRSPNWRNR
jgi:cyclohexa-1,5-dienecarbonyl-CoA hydratase